MLYYIKELGTNKNISAPDIKDIPVGSTNILVYMEEESENTQSNVISNDSSLSFTRQ